MKMDSRVLYQLPFCDFVVFSTNTSYSQNNYNVTNEFLNFTSDSGSGLGSGVEPVTVASIETTASTSLFDSSIWDILSPNCQLSTIITGAVGLVFLVLGLVFNIVLISAGNAVQQKPIMKKSDSAAVEKRKAFEASLTVCKYFRGSLGVSFILASVLLLLFIALSGYEILYSGISYQTAPGIKRVEVYKMVSCILFHTILSVSIFSMLGSVVERWATMVKLNPADYLEKVNYLMNAPSNKLRKRSGDMRSDASKSKKKPIAVTFLVLTWVASIAFGVLMVVYCEVQFFLFGEIHQLDQKDSFIHFSLLLKFQDSKMFITSIIYIVFLFFPLLLLILCLLFALCSFIMSNHKAKQTDSYNEAKFKSLSNSNVEFPLNHKLLQLTQSSNSKNDERDEIESSPRATPREEQPQVAEYSHRMEHERQVTLNCQESGLNGIQTDSIQVTVDPARDPNGANSKAPPPPEWLKLSSISRSRFSDNPAIQVVDLANSSLAISVDRARCYFGEANETRAVLIAYSAVAFFSLPLFAVIAIDVFASKHSIFRRNSNDGLIDGNLFSSAVISSVGICTLALFLLGGILIFFVFYSTSVLLKSATKRMCSSKNVDDDIQTMPNSFPSGSNLYRNGQSLSRNANPIDNNGSHFQRKLWSSKRPESLDIEGWRPEERPTSDAFPENHLDIDRRFALEEEDE